MKRWSKNKKKKTIKDICGYVDSLFFYSQICKKDQLFNKNLIGKMTR